MAAQRGRLLLLQTGTPLASVLTGRSLDISINGETVDVTTKSQQGWRELLADAGVRSMSITMEGVYTDDASSQLLTTRVTDQSVDEYTIIFDSAETFVGEFQAVSISISGTYNGEVAYSISLESSGIVVYDDGVI